MNKLLLIPIFATLLSCSTSEIEKNVAPELYPTEKCLLSWIGEGKILLIDKNHTLPDTIYKSEVNGSKQIDLIIRGYYELKIMNSNTINVILTNKNKTLINFNQKTNGLIYKFFNK